MNPAGGKVPDVDNGDVPPEIDTSKPHSARIYDYYLGGKDNFAADRETAIKAMKAWPPIRMAARENRAFLGRAVRYLAEEAGITQFLDLGSGLPGVGNVHEIAQDVNRAARVVYVDNDPIVLAHGRALLNSTPEGKAVYIEADMREPEKILDHPVTRDTLDFSKPVALIFIGVLHFFLADDEVRRIVEPLIDAVPSGSYVAAAHVTSEFSRAAIPRRATSTRAAGWASSAGTPTCSRTSSSTASRWCRRASWWCPSGARSRARSCRRGLMFPSTEPSPASHSNRFIPNGPVASPARR